MDIKNIKGLKYPDEYFIKFFFKYQLHTKQKLKYFELGCSNGCNLMLPFEFDNNVIGVDIDDSLIAYADQNFDALKKDNSFDFFSIDMRNFCHNSSELKADVLVLANSIYYIPKDDFVKLLKDIKQNSLIKSNIPFFIRFRELDDFRNTKGTIIEENSIIIKNGITGEDGVFCKFYDTDEMIGILKKELNLREFQTMHLRYDNIQNDFKVNSSEVVIWGVVN
ncbi:MAG: class I SAM-dependent methyltransferase [Sulfurimonas sp.]|nr:class I SAM-dependent methyltransferase [Sulfurimonas sp.]